MPPEHSESLEQGSPDSKPEASLPEPDSASLASDVPPSDTRIEEGEPESIAAPPSPLTGYEPAQAVEPPRNKSAMTLRNVRRRACFMIGFARSQPQWHTIWMGSTCVLVQHTPAAVKSVPVLTGRLGGGLTITVPSVAP